MPKKKTIKLKKGQKCYACKKEIKGVFCYNGFWWCEKCKDKDTKKRINKYIKEKEVK